MATAEPAALARPTARTERSGWPALAVVYVVWGSTYLAIRVGDESLPPFTMAALRYLVAGLVLLPFVAARTGPSERGTRRVRPSRRELAGCALTGVLMLAGGNGGVSWAETRLSSGLAALLVATVPLFMIAAERVVSRSLPSLRTVAALVVGFCGVGILASPGGHHESASGILAVLGASLSWAIGSLCIRRLPHPAHPLATTTYQMLGGGVALTFAAALSGELGHLDLGAVSVRSWLALAYLVGPGSILALTCYTEALRRLPTSVVGTYAYVNPIIAVFLGWSILAEQVRPATLLGGALVVGAVALVISEHRGEH